MPKTKIIASTVFAELRLRRAAMNNKITRHLSIKICILPEVHAIKQYFCRLINYLSASPRHGPRSIRMLRTADINHIQDQDKNLLWI